MTARGIRSGTSGNGHLGDRAGVIRQGLGRAGLAAHILDFLYY